MKLIITEKPKVAQKMAESLDEVSFPCRLVTVPEMGHEYPPDFSFHLDATLAYLLD